RAVPPDEPHPWMGRTQPARQIHALLTAPEEPGPGPVPLAELRTHPLTLPRAPGWVADPPTPRPGGTVVAGPALLAWYAEGKSSPRWAQTAEREPGLAPWTLQAPGPFAPAGHAGRLYSRWGVESVALE